MTQLTIGCTTVVNLLLLSLGMLLLSQTILAETYRLQTLAGYKGNGQDFDRTFNTKHAFLNTPCGICFGNNDEISWSPESMDGDRIKFQYKGEQSALYTNIHDDLGELYQLNDLPKLQQFCKYASHQIRTNLIFKCQANIFITGMVRSGKTTIAETMFPYFFTRETKYTSYRTIVISFDLFTEGSFEYNGTIDLTEQIITKALGFKEKANIFQCLMSDCDLNPILNLIRGKPTTMHYIIFDEIQLADPNVLAALKKVFKSNVFLGKNLLSIWTGSTQAVLFKKLKMIPSNGYSFSDNCQTYNITMDGEDNWKELRAYCNFRAKDYVIDKNVLVETKKIIGFRNCGHLDQLAVIMLKTGKGITEALKEFVMTIFTIYDRDFARTKFIENLSESEVLAFFISRVFKKDLVDQAKTELDIDDSMFFFGKESICLRDSLLHIYVDLKYHCEGGRLKPKPISSFDSFELVFISIFPFSILGEIVKNTTIPNLETNLGIKTGQHILFAKSLNEGLLKNHSKIDVKQPNIVNRILVSIRNILCHNIGASKTVYNLILLHWCGGSVDSLTLLLRNVRDLYKNQPELNQ